MQQDNRYNLKIYQEMRCYQIWIEQPLKHKIILCIRKPVSWSNQLLSY